MSSRQPIHSHHKKWLTICVFNASVHCWPFDSSWVLGYLPPLHKSSSHHFLSVFLLNLASWHLFQRFVVHHVRFISKYSITKCTPCPLVMRRDLVLVKKSYEHCDVLQQPRAFKCISPGSSPNPNVWTHFHALIQKKKKKNEQDLTKI